MQRAFYAVALLALACLLLRAARTGLAGDYVDPISHIATVEEAMNASSAIAMAQHGDWLTPRFMGRPAPEEAPLPIWASALSARLLGISRLSLRLPVALACSLALGLVFLFGAELSSWQSGVCAAALLASSHLWHVLASSCMAAGLLTACCIAAVYCLFADPWLETKTALWGFSGAVAAAILTSGIAGILPLGVLGLYWLAAPGKYKPGFLRVCMAAALSLALAAPWFLYQLAAHGRWIRVGAPPQASHENHALYYAIRTAAMDPVLVAVAVVALAGFVAALRQRSFAATLLLCWILATLAFVAAGPFPNAARLLPLLPAMAILGASYGPFSTMRPVWWMLALVAAAFVLKAGAPNSPAGISFAAGTVQPVAPLVSSYCEKERGNEFILAGRDDGFYAATLPLPRLRYAEDLVQDHSPAALAALITTHPDSDFLMPDRYRAAAASDSHVLIDAAPDHFFLLSRRALPAPPPRWSCGL
ncbi:MAG: glycosyltransferase family 39 protein [Candidatus Sulfopaludibacter sp.]|nr:glycosyltransferase family 39 protein [Candidatus Sulfopaludibacter sp.]